MKLNVTPQELSSLTREAWIEAFDAQLAPAISASKNQAETRGIVMDQEIELRCFESDGSYVGF